MNITLNGQPKDVADNITIEELLNQLKLDAQQVVIEQNRQIVPRQRHAETNLKSGDELEIVHFVGGG